MSKALALSFLAGLPYYVFAQTPQCSSGFQWSFNSAGLSPCDMATALGAVCAGSAFKLQPLNVSGLVYTGPPAIDANGCRCSSVYYSLLCACSACQLHEFIGWSNYDANCTRVYLQVFPEPLPTNISIPHYAYQNVQLGNSFNTTGAISAGGTESTASSQPTATGTSATTATTTSAAGKSSKSNVGAIAGGVVGGVVFLALLGVLITLILRRRKQSTNPTPYAAAAYNPGATPEPAMSYANMSYNPSTPSAMVPPKIYDPNDPSTFPTNDPVGYSTYTSSPDSNQQRPLITPTFTGTGSVVSVPRNTTHYTGAPEL